MPAIAPAQIFCAQPRSGRRLASPYRLKGSTNHPTRGGGPGGACAHVDAEGSHLQQGRPIAALSGWGIAAVIHTARSSFTFPSLNFSGVPGTPFFSWESGSAASPWSSTTLARCHSFVSGAWRKPSTTPCCAVCVRVTLQTMTSGRITSGPPTNWKSASR